ncbi:MAG: response regulator transcription factor [Pseudomonadales bacterium]|nr:response regulator transcription factor [Pseudomonadales bacterium]
MSNKPRILLVEDDLALGDVIKEYLESKEMIVDIVIDGLEAVDVILTTHPDLVILDLMLPNLSGIEVCKKIRPDYHGSILMLTASADPFDQVVGLEIGADDFVLKPVEPRILLARIRARLRRPDVKVVAVEPSPDQAPQKELVFGELVIRKAARQVSVSGHHVAFTGPEYDMLLCLVENIGEIQDRDALFHATRGIEYDGKSRMIDITISQIRQKLAEFGYDNSHIKTVRNRGYLFVPE